MTTNLHGVGDSTTEVPPHLPMWMLPKLYSQACAVYWNYLHISFSSQMIRFSSSGTCGTWPYPPFFVCHPFLLFLFILFFVRQKIFHVTNIIIDAKNSTARHVYMYNSQVAPSERYHIRKHMDTPKISCGREFCPTSLFNLCNALSECFYTQVLLDSSECFYWVPERCFVIQCDLATIIFQGKYTCKHSEVAAALR
jgi:hypothetical protein